MQDSDIIYSLKQITQKGEGFKKHFEQQITEVIHLIFFTVKGAEITQETSGLFLTNCKKLLLSVDQEQKNANELQKSIEQLHCMLSQLKTYSQEL